ncbi:DUF2934 domain-containing protein [Pedosphaera parvula]|uniref:DUF3341 domain-containing protein n=1 Tax=Pedosphaera parvula (strain Ellin514) TaxID=320771 RepID=B9XDJ8_PEDPL|nr:hypothetical protein Cflav_PD6419 [Pedosphaera parvula Ellin514]
MARRSIFCIAQTDSQAVEIVNQLKTAGFQHDDISVLFPDKQGSRDFAHQQQTKAPEGAVTGAGTGGALGGALGWLAGIGALAIPGIGPFIAAGPLMAALSGAAVGATLGGITGALIGMGIPEYEAKRYEGKIRSGNILISVHTDSSRNADKAKAIFENAGAEDIASAGEAAPKTKGRKEGAAEREEMKPRLRKVTTQAVSGGSEIAGSATSKTATGVPPVIIASTATNNGKEVAMPELTREEIAIRAQEIYVNTGMQPGRDVENWLEAEAQLKAERRANKKQRAPR